MNGWVVAKIMKNMTDKDIIKQAGEMENTLKEHSNGQKRRW